MKHLFSITFLILFANLWANNPQWLRHSSISPDGKYIAFSYKGDIYKVPTQGGQAIRLTTHTGHDTQPIWSPDSEKIAFVSNRQGGILRLFVMPSEGGKAQQLTFHSSSAVPYSFTKDGKYIVFSSSIQDLSQSALFPGKFQQLYKISLENKEIEYLFSAPAEAVSFNSNGTKFLYQDFKGVENQWRKHHTSSVTRDIWLYDFTNDSHSKIVDWKGEDRNPIYGKDDNSFYFLSERSGSFNIFKADINNPSQAKQLTFFKDYPVRFLSVADNGMISFGYDGELYTFFEGQEPQKVSVSIQNDVSDNQEVTMNFSSGATSWDISPDGKQVAMVIRGEVFVTSTEYATTRQITQTAAAENSVTFAKDGRSVVYASYRDGHWDLYKSRIARKEDTNFPNSLAISEEKLIPNNNSEKMFPKFSPDGKEIAFVSDRMKLVVYNLETQKIREITDGKYQIEKHGHINYQWSPDGKWFAIQYIARNHTPYYDIGIVSAEGGKEIFNITDSGYFDTDPVWVLDGNAIMWETEKYGMRNPTSWGSLSDKMIVFLNKEAFDKFRMNKEELELYNESLKNKKETEKKPENTSKGKKDKNKKENSVAKSKTISIDFNNIKRRIVRLTPNSSNLGSATITKDGKKLYYLSAVESGYDLWVHDLQEKSTRLLSKLNGASQQLISDQEGKKIFLLGRNKMQVMELPSEKIKGISYNASMKLDLVKERDFMFDMVKKEITERFYVKDLHGVNWEKLTKDYQKYLPHINNNFDFAEMLSELLGELNVSHTGSGYRAFRSPNEITAQLGIFIRPTDKGIVIDEIVVGGAFDNFQSKAEKGVIIEKIDGISIENQKDYYQNLEGKTGKKILVSLHNPNNGNRWEEVVKAINTAQWYELLYERWVQKRAEDVEKWSGGRLGYVHIPEMGDRSFREVYADVLGKYFEKEGIVIDIRYNGGGRLHEDIEVFFSGKKYLTQKVQGKKYGDMPSRRWTKASIMLINEADYSNAHGSPWVYKHTGIGKLIGMPVAGTMTSVNWVTLQDPSLYFGIPVVGYQKADGEYLENYELNPDILVPLNYPKVTQGEDNQLKAAVEELLKSL